MGAPAQLTCEKCGQLADIAQNVHVDAAGKRVEWPKVTVKPDGVYFTLVCPACGERQQLTAKRPGSADA
jgi:Fe2+ or Zn2+ uptake regulation protein